MLAKEIHKAVATTNFAGVFGGNQALYYGLAKTVYEPTGGMICQPCSDEEPEVAFESTFPKDVFATSNPVCPKYNDDWNRLVTIDPYGMYGDRPTISATTATMDIPELKDSLVIDGKVVNEDKSINCKKIAIEPVWYIPGMAKRLNVSEEQLRKELHKIYPDDKLMTRDVFLPPAGGSTVYLIGDFDSDGETTVRSHDECNGSDVFGTDICTCRPYLAHAIGEGVISAQKGGRGIICYNRKEGRALGEVVKFLVYNQRAIQSGGDRSETYFDQTKQIAGVIDARIQPLLPDTLMWLGVKKIDNWISMSNEKSNALRKMGIEIVNQYEIPKEMIPKRAHVEIDAKVAAGYFSKQ